MLMATVMKPATPPVMPRIAPREELSPFRIAQIQFDMAAEFLKLDPGLRQILRTPKRVLEVSIPTKMDNGQVKVLTGFRVQHNLARGPGKGGIRFHPNVTLDEVKALAMWMTWRSEEHTSELQSRLHLVCRLLLEKKKNIIIRILVLRGISRRI